MQGFHASTSLSVLRAAEDPEDRLPGDARTADVPPSRREDEDDHLDG